jgi:hypothetical protein
VVAVRNNLVATARPVAVLGIVTIARVPGRALHRIATAHAEAMLVDMISMHEMQMAVVQVVLMTVVHDRGVSAAAAVAMRVGFVRFVWHCSLPG